MGRSLKKGPFVDDHLMNKVEAQKDSQKETGNQNMVTPFNNFPDFYRIDDCCI